MSRPTTCVDLLNAISSPALGGGVTPFDWQAGQTIDLFGREVVPASRSQRAASKVDNRMSGTYGRYLPGSSASVALESSLANRLMKRLDGAGLMRLPTTSRAMTTPSLRRYSLHTLSAQHLRESGFISPPRPLASDNRDRGNITMPCVKRRLDLKKQIHLSFHFKRTPCPSCVLGMMGFPLGWLKSLTAALETQSSRKSRRSS